MLAANACVESSIQIAAATNGLSDTDITEATLCNAKQAALKGYLPALRNNRDEKAKLPSLHDANNGSVESTCVRHLFAQFHAPRKYGKLSRSQVSPRV